MAAGLLVVLVAAALGILSLIPGFLPPLFGDDPHRLTAVLSQTIDAKGIDAAVEQYRTLRAQGFRGLKESEADTNTLGYALLQKGHTQSAIQVFQLNIETHPASANVYDSLGEAYLAAGNKTLAIANYEKALAIAPAKRSTVAALQDLTGRKHSYRPLTLFHIFNGLLGILSGAVAMVLRKGSPRHTWAGRVFVVSMLCMSGSAAYVSFVDPNGKSINLLMGLLTFYLVATAWLTAYRKRPQTNLADWAGVVAIVAVAIGLASSGVEAANSATGTKDGSAAGLYFAFVAVASLAAVLDLRMIWRGGVSGAQRLTRHLWRMCTALFIAVGSFFLGQPQVFPVGIRNSGILAVPTLLVILSLGYWLFRVNAFHRLLPQRGSAPWTPQSRSAH